MDLLPAIDTYVHVHGGYNASVVWGSSYLVIVINILVSKPWGGKYTMNRIVKQQIDSLELIVDQMDTMKFAMKSN